MTQYQYQHMHNHKHRHTHHLERVKTLSLVLAALLLATNHGASAQPGVDYTCDVRKDYTSNPCGSLQDGICDDPNFGGSGGENCKQQDCIDCNENCKESTSVCLCVSQSGGQLLSNSSSDRIHWHNRTTSTHNHLATHFV